MYSNLSFKVKNKYGEGDGKRKREIGRGKTRKREKEDEERKREIRGTGSKKRPPKLNFFQCTFFFNHDHRVGRYTIEG